MARVDFYVLDATGRDARLRFACRLAEKAYRLKHTVRILATDQDEAAQVDELLWTWRDGSFVPHEVLASGRAPESPVTISFGKPGPGGSDLLINLRDTLPDAADAFPRIAEIVTSDDEQRRRSRRCFAAYREHGHTLETHKL